MNDKINELLYKRENYRAEEAITEITDIIHGLMKQNDALKQENEQLKSEHYKDEEITRLKEQIQLQQEAMTYGFPITKERYEKIMELCKKHEWEKHGRKGNGYFNYCFAETEIGTFGWAKCCDCGEEIKFLEADEWIFG